MELFQGDPSVQRLRYAYAFVTALGHGWCSVGMSRLPYLSMARACQHQNGPMIATTFCSAAKAKAKAVRGEAEEGSLEVGTSYH